MRLSSLLALPWRRFENQPVMRDIMVRQGMLRQALLPANHAFVGSHADLVRRAIRDSVSNGNFTAVYATNLLEL